MQNHEELFKTTVEATTPQNHLISTELKSLLEQAYGVDFSIIDGHSGELLHQSTNQPGRDWGRIAELCRTIAAGNQPEFIDEEDPFITLGIPFQDDNGNSVVAVATFLSRPLLSDEKLETQARMLGMDSVELTAWAKSQLPWNADLLTRISKLVLDNAAIKQRLLETRQEADSLSVNLAATYEEISLLHRLTQNLKLSRSDEDLGRIALDWMQEVVPAECLVIQFLPAPDAEKSLSRSVRDKAILISNGLCPLDNEQFSALIEQLGEKARHQPVVINRPVTQRPTWPFPQVRELIVAPMVEGDKIFGWLAAFNHTAGGEFGTIEANLLSSVAAILGIHGGNIDLYRQQSDLLSGIVRALTSAIDAKDPYTCGHSDRVARIAVRLAEELGCDPQSLNTVYLAGLLHDIGKIGISDNVLRKPGKLSETEYEHIKQHVNIGHRILRDLAKLEGVLPVVLHHHESWDGGGYPQRLDAERIPLPARIVAVADAFDAMTSDRPYRKGMSEDRVEAILKEGAGKQWDPEVIAAFFRARDDIRRICQEDKSSPEPDTAGIT